MSLEKLEYILKQGSTERCLEFFQDMPESERRTYAKLAGSRLEKAYKESFQEVTQGSARYKHWIPSEQLPAACCAALATLSFAEIKRRARQLASAKDDLIYAVFASRKPDWLTEWAEWHGGENTFSWPLIRRLVREEVCQKPAGESYILGMIVGLCAFHDHKSTIYDNLLADPDLLEDEIWRLFEVEGDKEHTLAARDKYTREANTWTAALVRLAEEKRIPRARLLDCSLSALERDFKEFHAGWFSQFHEALQPTPSERIERQAHYLTLLASRNPPTVSFALKSLQIIGQEGRLDPQGVLGAIGPALWSPKKGTVESALRLLDNIATEKAECREQALLIALDGFQHEKPDVHKAVFKLLEKHAKSLGKRHFQLLREKGEVVVASLRKRLSALLPGNFAEPEQRSEPESEASEQELLSRAAKVDQKWAALAGVPQAIAAVRGQSNHLPAIRWDPMAIPHLDPDGAVRPIQTLNELIDGFAHVLEDQNDPMEVERVLDGVARLCDQKPADFASRTGPLAKRAQTRNPLEGSQILPSLCGVAIAWTQSRPPQRHDATDPRDSKKPYVYYEFGDPNRTYFTSPTPPTVPTFLAQRLRALAERAALGQAGPLLSTPTHRAGWIDPRVLAARTLELNERSADIFDQVLALLRLAPEHRSEALESVANVAGEWGDALRYALGAPPPSRPGPSAGLWVAAARARAPRSDDALVDQHFPGLGPDAGQAARIIRSIRKWPNTPAKFLEVHVTIEPKPEQPPHAELATVLLNGGRADRGFGWNEFNNSDVPSLRWIATLWPARLEPLFAKGAVRFSHNLDWWQAEWENKTFLEPLLDPDTPFEPMGLLLLTLGLAAKDAGEHGLATDILIAAIDDGRMDGELLGGILAELLPSGLVKAARLAKTLAQAARPSPLHASMIATAIERSLRGDPAKAPRDLSQLLELLHELLAERAEPVRTADARQYLQGLKAGGKTGRLVRDLLSNDSSAPSAISKTVALRALEGRLGRAERWQSIP